ncbi:vesicular fusion ATPase-like protein [Dothistroma septosporum NZE10]|uniref:Vesicular-fusion protein SEC18 n=1 Tax=Dothistroma septosporum (strain NZE10 / CBS 128990) TaxID=675120 RepID=N1PM18_DOTSN|nr:vesicular fusion ATPase-like protein [Dothistroma septosporum NZE10]
MSMFNRNALFGSRQEPSPGQQTPVRPSAGQPEPRYDQQPPRHNEPPRDTGRMRLQPVASPKELIFSNVAAVSPQDIGGSREEVYLLINGQYVLTARPHPAVQRGQIGLNEFQRTWMQVAFTDVVEAERYDPFRQGKRVHLGNMDVEIGFAGKTSSPNPFDQDELADCVKKTFQHQIFTPGQTALMDFKSAKLRLTIRLVEMVDLMNLSAGTSGAQSDPRARGILTPETVINFFKDAKSPINLKGSTRRPAANSVLRPDFKFEDMGIGGLDKEFSDIFRRAFASRIFPPGLVDQLGIQHVRGMLLYGPPGTGKTLIARQIGKMLNAREPKVINGPEVLNKYVGQSEENIRKLFADAEKEQKEKGDESGLHIIIFDELDAVCKQRGSGAGGGTGVGDSVVNQLLSKLDGVDQLNNVLLIGMTNRKDMIDEALLRSGRLEVHMEISLPDEFGRGQILKIHTNKMRENGKLAADVDLAILAKETRNFSGAEISGLVKAASSFALQRHIKGGTVAAVSDDIQDMKLRMADFELALQEVKPLFGVNEADLEDCLREGIISFGPQIEKIQRDGATAVDVVRQAGNVGVRSVLLYGPTGSGKTALAARIALDSQFPFIKIVKAGDMVGMNELQKMQHLSKVFTDAYKSPLNALVVDRIEYIIDWVPVGPRFSAAVLQTLKNLMEMQPPLGRPLLILATTSNKQVIQQLELEFDQYIPVPNLQTPEELANVMRAHRFDEAGIGHALQEIERTTGSRSINVSIKKILRRIERADRDPDNRAGTFAELICEAKNEA